MATETHQAALVTEPGPEISVAPPVVEEHPNGEVKGEVPAPEDVAATTVVEPLKDEVNAQPTATHAEQGNTHTEAEPATQVDGTPADKPVEETPAAPVTASEEAKEDKKEDKKAAVKEKVEKTKAEGKGFFAKFFGSKEKSPKKEKKVKTPKVEKAEPTAETTAATETPAVAESSESAKVGEPKVEEPVVAETAPVVEAPVVEATPEASTSAAVVESEPTKETEVTAAPVAAGETPTTTEDKPVEETTAKEGSPKLTSKTTRRLSARFTSWAKGLAKKEHSSSPKDEKAQEAVEGEAAPATVVTTEAPQLEKPIETEPLKLEEPAASSSSAPPAAPIVSATA